MARKRPTRSLFQGVTDFFSEMNRMSGVMHGRSYETQPRTEASAWAPLTDIKAHGSDLIICCELPGIEMKNIDISLANGVLTISGKRQTSDDEYYVRERFYGSFRRSISLPDGTGEKDIQATLSKGLLVITIHGAATAAEPKTIRIINED